MADIRLDPDRSWTLWERHERHFYPAADGQHLFDGSRCLCLPRTNRRDEHNHDYYHNPLGGDPMKDEPGA